MTDRENAAAEQILSSAAFKPAVGMIVQVIAFTDDDQCIGPTRMTLPGRISKIRRNRGGWTSVSLQMRDGTTIERTLRRNAAAPELLLPFVNDAETLRQLVKIGKSIARDRSADLRQLGERHTFAGELAEYTQAHDLPCEAIAAVFARANRSAVAA